MEPFLISKVEETFTIFGRGCCVVPGVPKEGLPHSVRVGDQIELRLPDGSRFQTRIGGIEHATLIKGGSQWPIRFPADVKEEYFPAGTEIWWIGPSVK
jgi:hypothetical protein